MTEIAVRDAAVPAIPPRLQEAGFTVREIEGFRTIGIAPAAREKYNVIFPTVELSQQNPDFHPMIREIKLSADDVYTGASHHKNGECSLGKAGLLRLAEAAKIDIETLPIARDYLGPTERCGWRATARQRHSDGTQTTFTGSATFDNEAERDTIAAEVATAVVWEKGVRTNQQKFPAGPAFDAELDKRWRVKTRKASELTETFAIERAIRGILKLPQKMKTADATGKPWAVVCFAYIPTTPEARHAAAQALTALYGTPMQVAPLASGAAAEGTRQLAPASVPDDEERQDAEEAAAASETAAATAPDEPQLEEDDEAREDEIEDAVVVDEGAREQTETDAAQLQELAARAASVKPPTGSYQTKTLQQILDRHGESGRKWLRWAFEKDWAGDDAEFGRMLHAFCRVNLPELAAETEGGDA